MNQQFRKALESMLNPEENGWAFNEEQRDCARILLGMEPVVLPKDTDPYDVLGMQDPLEVG